MPADDLIGERLGPYTILGWLGEGAMARVYRARHERQGKEVALKVVRRVPGDREDSAARFQREKAVLEKLHHPHILAIYDYSGNSDYLFIASPVIEGGTLEDRLGCWPANEVAEIVAQLGGALDYAHQMNVVHRDIKPSNVLIDRRGDGLTRHYYLADFGVAKMLEAEGLTMPGMTVGTPEYMSPEQVMGKPLGAPADQYSLAILAYRLLTGKVPFTGSMPSVMQQHAKATPPPLGPDVPDAVERVILRALSKDPGRRFKSGTDFAEAMLEATGGRVQAPMPVAAPAPPAFSGPLADGPPRPPEPKSWVWMA
ncbi:unnamed protein product, partial [Phaeothamnion confervicola]